MGAFCLAIWSCAKASTEGHKPWEAFTSICQNSSSSPKVEAARKRISPDSAGYVEQCLREVARELLGLPSEEVAAGPKAAQAWQACAAYFADRTQSTNQQCPGRAADMSQEAAGAFIAAVKTVASKAEGGNKQPLLP